MISSKQSHILYGLMLFVMIARHTLYLEELLLVDRVLSVLRFAFIPVCVYLLVKNKKQTTLLDWGMVVYGCIILYSSLYHHILFADIVPFISTTLDIFIIWTILRTFFANNDDFPVKALTISLSLFIYLNFILLLLFPNGIWEGKELDAAPRFFLGGNYNQMGKAFILAIALNSIYTHRNAQLKKNLILLSAISVISLLLVGSKTSTVGVIILILFTLLPSAKLRSAGLLAFVIVYCVFQVTIVFQGNEVTNHYVVDFVENVLHKDMTFTYRTDIWYQSVLSIAHSPVIGYGYQSPEWYEQEIGGVMPHNYVLSVLMKGGLILLLCTISNVLLAYRQYRKHNNYTHQILFITLFVMLFMQLFEVYSFAITAILFTCLSYIHLIDERNDKTTAL